MNPKEKEVLWQRKATTMKQVENLVRKAADRLNWDPDIVWGMVQDRWTDDYSDLNCTDEHFGFSITWDGEHVTVYMYSD